MVLVGELILGYAIKNGALGYWYVNRKTELRARHVRLVGAWAEALCYLHPDEATPLASVSKLLCEAVHHTIEHAGGLYHARLVAGLRGAQLEEWLGEQAGRNVALRALKHATMCRALAIPSALAPKTGGGGGPLPNSFRLHRAHEALRRAAARAHCSFASAPAPIEPEAGIVSPTARDNAAPAIADCSSDAPQLPPPIQRLPGSAAKAAATAASVPAGKTGASSEARARAGMLAAECADARADACDCSCHVAQSMAARASAARLQSERGLRNIAMLGSAHVKKGLRALGAALLPGYRVVYHASGESYTPGPGVRLHAADDVAVRNDRVWRVVFMLGEIVFEFVQYTVSRPRAGDHGVQTRHPPLVWRASECCQSKLTPVRDGLWSWCVGESVVSLSVLDMENAPAHANAEASDSHGSTRELVKRPSRRMSMSDKAGLCEQSSAVILQQLIMAEMMLTSDGDGHADADGADIGASSGDDTLHSAPGTAIDVGTFSLGDASESADEDDDEEDGDSEDDSNDDSDSAEDEKRDGSGDSQSDSAEVLPLVRSATVLGHQTSEACAGNSSPTHRSGSGSSGGSSYTVYVIRVVVDSGPRRHWIVRRRYNAFSELHKRLRREHKDSFQEGSSQLAGSEGGRYLPLQHVKFPSKTLIGHANPSKRAHALDMFLFAACHDTVVRRSAALHEFLRADESCEHVEHSDQADEGVAGKVEASHSSGLIARIGRAFKPTASPPLAPSLPQGESTPKRKLKVLSARPGRWSSEREDAAQRQREEVFDTWLDRMADGMEGIIARNNQAEALEAAEREQRAIAVLKSLCARNGLSIGGGVSQLEQRLMMGLGWDKATLHQHVDTAPRSWSRVAVQSVPSGGAPITPPRHTYCRTLPNSAYIMHAAAADAVRRKQREKSWVRKLTRILHVGGGKDGGGGKSTAAGAQRSVEVQQNSRPQSGRIDANTAPGSPRRRSDSGIGTKLAHMFSATAADDDTVSQRPALATKLEGGAFYNPLPNSLYLQQTAQKQAANQRHSSNSESWVSKLIGGKSGDLKSLWWRREEAAAVTKQTKPGSKNEPQQPDSPQGQCEHGTSRNSAHTDGAKTGQDDQGSSGRDLELEDHHSLLSRISRSWWSKDGAHTLNDAQHAAGVRTSAGTAHLARGGLLFPPAERPWAPPIDRRSPAELRARVLAVAKASPPPGSATPVLLHSTGSMGAQVNTEDADMRAAMSGLRRRLRIERIERETGEHISDGAMAIFLIRLCADPQRRACSMTCEESSATLPFWHPFVAL